MSIYDKFLKWLFTKVKSEIRNSHLNKVHNDIKCPFCNEWFSISGLKYKHKYEKEPKFGNSLCTCGQCGYKSIWSPFIAPFPVLVDDNGQPIK